MSERELLWMQYDALQRIPEDLRERITFFSDYDLWEYHLDPALAGRHCDICNRRREMSVVIGSVIRALFSDLTIEDANKILVNEHPNCGCWLTRIGMVYLT